MKKKKTTRQKNETFKSKHDQIIPKVLNVFLLPTKKFKSYMEKEKDIDKDKNKNILPKSDHSNFSKTTSAKIENVKKRKN